MVIFFNTNLHPLGRSDAASEALSSAQPWTTFVEWGHANVSKTDDGLETWSTELVY